jgi:signal transduction histidine kinase
MSKAMSEWPAITSGERDYFDLALRKMPVGVVVIEDFHRVVAANRQAYVLLAGDKGVLLLRSVADIDLNLLLSTTRGSFSQSLTNENARWYCVEGVSTAGKRLQITVQHCGLGNSSRQLSIVTLCDITWLIDARFEGDDDVNLVSHDMRFMLNSIRLSADRIKQDHARSDHRALGDSLDKITQRANQLLELTEAFLENRLLDRRELVSRRPVDLVEIVAGACEEAQLVARAKQVKVRFECIEKIQIDGNFSLLSRCMLNLLGNSIRSSPIGGLVEVQMMRAKTSVTITIDDEGPGFPVEVLHGFYLRPDAAKLPTLRSIGHSHGHGLGLRLALKVARLHGAKFVISNRPSGGAHASLIVPLSVDC